MSQVAQLKQKFITWFAGHSESEQRLLKLAGGFLAIFIVYNVISSVQSQVTESVKKRNQQQELNAWVSQQLAQIKQLNASGSNNKRRNKTSLTQAVNQNAKRHGIIIERIQPQTEDIVRVGIDEVPFNSLMNWLKDLQTRNNITVVNIDFSEAAPGMVKIRRLDLGR